MLRKSKTNKPKLKIVEVNETEDKVQCYWLHCHTFNARKKTTKGKKLTVEKALTSLNKLEATTHPRGLLNHLVRQLSHDIIHNNVEPKRNATKH